MRRLYSYSRRATLDRCLRQYFYEYYASDKRCQTDPDEKPFIRALKAMSGCALLAGTILHRFARLYVTRDDLSPAWLSRTALSHFDQAVEFASDPRANAHLLNSKFPPQELVEFSYDDLAGEEAAHRARHSLEKALDHLFRGDAVRALFQELTGFTLHAEKRFSGLKLREWSISGQIDVLAVREDSVRVVDWKLGSREHGADSLQLHTYGWFASRFTKKPKAAVAGQRVFLGDDFVEKPQIVSAELDQVGRARLHQDIELMQDLHPYGRAGKEDVFRPCNHEAVCRRCNFRALCHKAQLRSNSNVISGSPRVVQVTA